MSTTGQYTEGMEKSKFRSRAGHLIEEDVLEPAQHLMERARQISSKAVDRSADIVRENPGYSVLGAAAVGFILGAYVSRRR